MKKCIWIVNMYCNPYRKISRQVALSKYLIQNGYDVYVLCGSSIHGTKENYLKKNELFKKIKVNNTNYIMINTKGYSIHGVDRVVTSLCFLKTIWKNHEKLPIPDVIVSDFAGIFGNKFFLWKKKYGTKIIFDVLDLWPEVFVEMNIINKNNPITRYMYYEEYKSYKKADGIIFSFEGGKEYLIDKHWDIESGGKVDLSKVKYLNNGLDLEIINNCKQKYEYNNPLFNNGKFSLVYLGSIRKANNIDILVDVARELKKRKKDDVQIIVFGEGDCLETLKRKSEDLNNIFFEGPLNIKYAPSMLEQANVLFWNFLDLDILKYGLSNNKLFMYFTSGKPVISCVKCNYDLIKSNNCGYVVDLNYTSIVDAIDQTMNLAVEDLERIKLVEKKLSKEFDYKNLSNVLIDQIERFTY